MNTKIVFDTIGSWVTGLVHLFGGLVSLGVMSEILFGTGPFGANVIANITNLVTQVGSAGFAGVVSLLILISMFTTTKK